MIDLWHKHAFGLVFLLLPSFCVSLTCLQCTGSISPRNCGQVKKCGSHEACYMDHYVTASGYIRYNLGCRDRQFCKTTAGRRSIENLRLIPGNRTNPSSHDDFIIRSAGDVKMCETCCDTDICNNAGCGVTGYSSRQSRGPVCYTCAQQHSPETCDVISVCGKNSICKVKFKDHLGTGDVYYSSTCEDAQICHQDAQYNNAIAVGRRALTEEVDTASNQCVVKCCDGDLCNGECGNGGTTLVSTSATAPANPCSSTNCVYGTCQPSGSSFVCVCPNGYSGVHCGHVLPACVSSPCVHGTCHNQGTGYLCVCTSGYTGTNCDHRHATSCPTSYTSVPLASGGNTCLQLHAGAHLTHAQDLCKRTNNGHLVTLDTAAKREAVKSFLNHKQGLTHGTHVWTGLTWDTHHRWHWHSGASISTSDQFTKSWLSAHAHPGQKCAAMGMQKNGDWDIKDCGTTHKYICEYP